MCHYDATIDWIRQGRTAEAAMLIGIGQGNPCWHDELGSRPMATNKLLDSAAREHPHLVMYLPALLHMAFTRWYEIPAGESEPLKKTVPSCLPLLLCFAAEHSEAWKHAVAADPQRRARGMLLSELRRERTSVEVGGLRRGSFNGGYFIELFEPFIAYEMNEAVPVLTRYAERGSWGGRAIWTLGRLGSAKAITAIEEILARTGHPVDQPRSPTTDRQDELRTYCRIALAMSGRREFIDPCIALIADYTWFDGWMPAEAMQWCMPVRGPEFPWRQLSEREKVQTFWRDWYAQHRDRLTWERNTRKYVLSMSTTQPAQ